MQPGHSWPRAVDPGLRTALQLQGGFWGGASPPACLPPGAALVSLTDSEEEGGRSCGLRRLRSPWGPCRQREGSQDRQATAREPSGKAMMRAQRIFPVAGKSCHQRNVWNENVTYLFPGPEEQGDAAWAKCSLQFSFPRPKGGFR